MLTATIVESLTKAAQRVNEVVQNNDVEQAIMKSALAGQYSVSIPMNTYNKSINHINGNVCCSLIDAGFAVAEFHSINGILESSVTISWEPARY